MFSDDRDQSERRIWDSLEFHVSREMQKQPISSRLGLWCDGFIPEQYLLDQEPRHIIGHAWIGIGPRHQERWKFVLTLPPFNSDRMDAIWSDLLPTDEANAWLVIAPEKKEMEITLAGSMA